MNNITKILSVRHPNKYSLFVVFLLLWCPVLLLLSCEQDNLKQTGPVGQGGEEVIVNFTLNMFDFGSNEMVTPRRASFEPSGASFSSFGGNKERFEETVVMPIKDNLSLSATLTEDQKPVELRALTTLKPYSKVRIIAYLLTSNDTVYQRHADYEYTGTILSLISSPALSVIPGLTYKFVAYSFDSTDPLPTFSPTLGPFPVTSDVLWGETTATVTPASFHLTITLYHLTAKVTVVANAIPAGLLNDIINSIQNTWVFSHTTELTVKSGGITQQGLMSGYFSWLPGDAPTRTSNPNYLFPMRFDTTLLILENPQINGITYSGAYGLFYGKPLEAGKSYTLQVNFIYSHSGSANRITVSGSGGNSKLVITNEPNDPGLYFKFGSVVGIQQPASVTFNLSDIVFNPLASPGSITGYGDGSGSNYTTDLPGIPCYSNVNWNPYTYFRNNVSSDSYHNLDNVKMGKGDPCRLIGMTANEIRGFTDDEDLYTREAALAAAGIGGWRLPTNVENQRFSGQTSNVAYNQHFWDDNSGPNVSPFGVPPVMGGEFPKRKSIIGTPDLPNVAKFLPSGGFLLALNGNYANVDSQGLYWSSEAFWYALDNVAGGYALRFGDSFVDPVFENTPYQTRSHNVRCVRDTESPITVSVDNWNNGGTLGTGGEGDIVIP